MNESGARFVSLFPRDSPRYPSDETRACSTAKPRALPEDDGAVNFVPLSLQESAVLVSGPAGTVQTAVTDRAPQENLAVGRVPVKTG